MRIRKKIFHFIGGANSRITPRKVIEIEINIFHIISVTQNVLKLERHFMPRFIHLNKM